VPERRTFQALPIVWGSILTVGGLVGLAYGLWEGRTMANRNWLWMAALGVTWAAIGYDYYDRHHVLTRPLSAPIERIYSKSFLNQTVEIDGKTFDHCHFENVTFMFHGRAGWNFIQPTFQGSLAAATDNQSMLAFEQFHGYLSTIPGLKGTQLFDVDQNGNRTPIGPMTTPVPPPASATPQSK